MTSGWETHTHTHKNARIGRPRDYRERNVVTRVQGGTVWRDVLECLAAITRRALSHLERNSRRPPLRRARAHTHAHLWRQPVVVLVVDETKEGVCYRWSRAFCGVAAVVCRTDRCRASRPISRSNSCCCCCCCRVANLMYFFRFSKKKEYVLNDIAHVFRPYITNKSITNYLLENYG